ncbi:MAG TPA: GNAT family N-acetyltransferase [Geminicoccus sp.]|jgi:phosphinothricin acetyltransferase|uniref:GNAT family N-acetyltransferase n=1 Tax=Geminicoccus sp. TaxID=2024832 RepID=UPI002E36FF2B|nr:N-acetyltransferase family protein [Geminicoccus sp.]HEX2528896.1 GNAT family N-acetyltransferase [Geminicoccus sp.]
MSLVPGAGPAGHLAVRPVTRTEPTANLRLATEADLPAIVAIYAEQLAAGLGSWEEIAPDYAAMAARFAAVRAADLPWLVAADPDGRVLGYAHARPFRALSAYRHTVEDSIHVAAAARGQGVGRHLLDALCDVCAARGYRQMIAVIGDARNRASIGLHEACGFKPCGFLPGAGEKAGEPVDVVMMQRGLLSPAGGRA